MSLHHYSPIRLAKIEKNITLSVTEDVMQLQHSYNAHGNTKHLEQLKKVKHIPNMRVSISLR